ncbi:MAG: GNAT family N-acetyltransferase [Lachnospiraceae bacterium]|nr:GNAT family N-acetyltransferase [Lachnospiraceae bacterium]
MKYIWQDYIPEAMEYIETWLDEGAVRTTGLDDGWKYFYEYWKNEDDCTLGENFWCKVVFEDGQPFGAVAFGLWEGSITIMELLIAPQLRGQGRGTALLQELLRDAVSIIGQPIRRATAVVFLTNPASQRAFEKSGFVFDYEHRDLEALCINGYFPALR